MELSSFSRVSPYGIRMVPPELFLDEPTPKQGAQTTHMKNIVHWSHRVSPAFLSAALLLFLTAGCAHQSAQTQPTFSELPPPAPLPTSDRGDAAVVPVAGGAVSEIAPPPGAPAEDWALAETIRAELTRDKSLAHAPMEAVVNKGTVTLLGYAPNQHARQRIHERIASLQGVKQVDDQMEIKNTMGPWRGINRDFEKSGQ
jgi:hypothetical protein